MSPHDSWGAMPAQHEEPYEPTATEYDRLGVIQDALDAIAPELEDLVLDACRFTFFRARLSTSKLDRFR